MAPRTATLLAALPLYLVVQAGGGEPARAAEPCRAVLAQRKAGSGSHGLRAFLRSLKPQPTIDGRARPRPARVRLTVDANGAVLKVELLRSSRLREWDQQIIAKAKIAAFPEEAKACGGLVIEPEIALDALGAGN